VEGFVMPASKNLHNRRHSKTLGTTEAALPQFNGVAINGGFLLATAPLSHRPELLLIAL
jgi:hypothetical protein